MAKEVRQSKYKLQEIPDKKKPKPVRKEKHKGDKNYGTDKNSTGYKSSKR